MVALSRPARGLVRLAVVGLLAVGPVSCRGDGAATTPPGPTMTPSGGAAVAAPTAARYRVTFDATWSAASHPQDFPRSAHFSALIGATHAAGVSFWRPGDLATEGITRMAELGSTSPLDTEIEQAPAGDAGTVIRGGDIPRSPGQATAEFEVTQDFPYAMVVSMIAPSPDWFVGVYDVRLFDGEWQDQVVIDASPWDAGTDSGVTYGAPDEATVPPQPIAPLEGPPVEVDGQVPPFGRFVFRLMP